MASPINQPTTTTQVTQTGTTVTTTTTGIFGDHTVTTTGSGQTESVAQTTQLLANQDIQDIADYDTSAVNFTAERNFSITSPSTGDAGPTAQAAHSAGMFALHGGRRPSVISSSDSSDTSSVSGSTGSSDLGDLEHLAGSERSEGAEGPEGPGGLPENAIPEYDPTDKTSILQFLQNPAVQQKMQTKGGHYVFVDEARSSFIFVRNGDWKTAESIKVTNAKTKENLTKPADLEMCVAKFCVGYENIHADWTNRVQPTIAERAGVSGGDYNHLMLSMKFKTAVVYGPWNAKESSSGYTPSAWRRGAEVKAGPIWDDVGPLKGINWKATPSPDFSFLNETQGTRPSTSSQGSGPTAAPSGGSGTPTVKVDLGGINVNLGGFNLGGITTNVTTGASPSPSTSSTTQGTSTEDMNVSHQETNTDDKTVRTESRGSGSTISEDTIHYADVGPGVDNESPPTVPAPPGPPPNISGTRLLNISNQQLASVLSNVRKHLNVAYNTDGRPVTNLNQNLGQVIRNTENGENIPTVVLPGINDGPGDGVSGSEVGATSSLRGGAASNSIRGAVPGGDSNVVDNRGLLARVREHLNDVYPAGSQNPVSTPLNNGVTLGSIIKGESSSDNIMHPYKPETVAFSVAKRVFQNASQSSISSNSATANTSSSSQKSENAASSNKEIKVVAEDGSVHFAKRVDIDGERSNGSPRTSPRSTTMNLSQNSDDLRSLLQKIRTHLDNSYEGDNPLHTGGGHIRDIIQGKNPSTSSPKSIQATLAKIIPIVQQSSSTPIIQQSQQATIIPAKATTSTGTGSGSVSTQSTGVGTETKATASTGTGSGNVSTQSTGVGTETKATTSTGTGSGSVSTQSTGVGTETKATTSTGTGSGSVSTQSTGVGTETKATTSTGTGSGSVSTQSTGVGTETKATTSTGTGSGSVSTQSTGVGTETKATASISTQTPEAPLPSGTKQVATISMVRNAAGRCLVVQQGARSQTFAIPLESNRNPGPQLWAAARQVAMNMSEVLNQATGETPTSPRPSPGSSPTRSPRSSRSPSPQQQSSSRGRITRS